MKAAIFDRDGVLTDFDIAAAMDDIGRYLDIDFYTLLSNWEKWGAQNGFPASETEEQAFFSGFWREIAARTTLSTADLDGLLQIDYTRYLRLFPETVDALLAVRDAGLKIGVLSNFSLASLERSLDSVGLLEYVDVVGAGTIIGAYKPDPRAYLYVTERLQVEPSACYFFDDEQENVDGARALGMQAWLIAREEDETLSDCGRAQTLSIVHDLLGSP